MEPDEIVRRLEKLRARIRAELADSPPPAIGADLPDTEPIRLDEAELPPVATEPNLNSTRHLERANELAPIGGPVSLRSEAPVVGPVLDLVRRLMRPLVQPFIDPYVDRQERFNAEVVRHLNELGARLETRLGRVWDDLVARASDPRLLEARLEAALSDYDTALRQRHAVLFDALEQELWALRQAVADAGQGDLADRLAALEGKLVERAQAVDRRFDEKDRALEEAFDRVASDILAQVGHARAVGVGEAELMETRTLLREALERTGAEQGREGEASAPRFDSELQERLRGWMADQDYRAFQDEFRGDASAIRERMEGHLEVFRGAPGPVADLGCGRGEFLDLLAGEDIDAVGVEINAADVEECRSRGHRAEEGDLFEWLEARPPGSLGGIFLAQVIEHLPPPAWSRFIDLAATRLAPGGVLLVETINPESLYALGRAYVLDPTHTRPVHPDLLGFFATRAGFENVEVRLQAAVPDEVLLTPLAEEPGERGELVREINRRLRRINEICCAPQEYALVARRPAAGTES